MDHLSKLEFNTIKMNGSKYLTWALNAEMYFDAHELGDAIKDEK